jgi:hypothetical protein
MKLEAFKKIIKDSLREVLKEEGLLNENKINSPKSIMTEQIKTTPYHTNLQITSTGDPLQDLLKQTAMESHDLSNFA